MRTVDSANPAQGNSSPRSTCQQLYQQMIRIAAPVLFNESDISSIVQRNGIVSLTFREEANDVISVTQYATFYSEDDVTVKYMLCIDHQNHLATPLAVVLSAPPATIPFEATESMAEYLLSLFQIAVNCEQY